MLTAGFFPGPRNPSVGFLQTRVQSLSSIGFAYQFVSVSCRRYAYTVTFDEAFSDVMKICADVPRKHEGSWIVRSFSATIASCTNWATHSVEVWEDETLVGGLYGIQMGGSFSGESMFSLRPDASRIAFAALCVKLDALGMTWFDIRFSTITLRTSVR